MYDSYKRHIYYLRISVTDRCNLRCRYCMPEEGVTLKRHDQILSYEEIVKIASSAAAMGFWKLRITGGEPLVRQGVTDLVRQLSRIPGVREVNMTTNGVLLDRYAEELKRAGLDRINISLDTLDPERYRWITRGGEIGKVMDGIRAAGDAGFKNTKLNMVLLESTSEAEVSRMADFCEENGLRMQRIHQYSLSDIHTIPEENRAERPLPCSMCNRIRLTADGHFKPCLFSEIAIPVDMDRIGDCIRETIHAKPHGGTACMSMGNWQIGG